MRIFIGSHERGIEITSDISGNIGSVTVWKNNKFTSIDLNYSFSVIYNYDEKKEKEEND